VLNKGGYIRDRTKGRFGDGGEAGADLTEDYIHLWNFSADRTSVLMFNYSNITWLGQNDGEPRFN
jgi:hypothetical protein